MLARMCRKRNTPLLLVGLQNVKTQIIPFCLQLVLLCPCLDSGFLIGPLRKSRVLKSPTLIVLGAMCALSFSKVSFTSDGALTFGA